MVAINWWWWIGECPLGWITGSHANCWISSDMFFVSANGMLRSAADESLGTSAADWGQLWWMANKMEKREWLTCCYLACKEPDRLELNAESQRAIWWNYKWLFCHTLHEIPLGVKQIDLQWSSKCIIDEVRWSISINLWWLAGMDSHRTKCICPCFSRCYSAESLHCKFCQCSVHVSSEQIKVIASN